MRAFVRDGDEIQYLLMAGSGDPHDDLNAFVGDAPAYPRAFPLKRNVGAVHEDDHAFGKPALLEFERGGKYLPDGSAYGLAGHRQADRLVEVIDYLVLGHATFSFRCLKQNDYKGAWLFLRHGKRRPLGAH